MTRAKAQKLARPKPLAFAVEPDFDDEAGMPEAIRAINALAGTEDEREWSIDVYMMPSGSLRGGGKLDWLFSVEPGELAALKQRLADIYPEGGKFDIQARVDGKMFKRFQVGIARRPGYIAPIAGQVLQQPVPPPTNNIEMIFARMAEQQQQFMQGITAILTRPVTPPPDPLTTLKPMIETMQAMAAMAPNPDPELSMKMFNQGIDLATKLHEASGGGDGGMAGMLKTVLDSEFGRAIGGAVAQLAQNAPQRQALAPPADDDRTPAPHMPFPAQALAPLPAQQQQPMPQQQLADPMAMLNDAMPFLIERASTGTDPKFAAEWIASNVPEPVFAFLENQEHDIPDFIAETWPQTVPHRAWFEAVIDILFPADDDLAQQQAGQVNDAGRVTTA